MLLFSVQHDDPFAHDYEIGPIESNGLRLHFFETTTLICCDGGEWTTFEAFLENTSNSSITVIGGASTLNEIDLGEYPSFKIDKKLRAINENTQHLNRYGDLVGRMLKEPLSRHHPMELKAGEIGLLFSITIPAEKITNWMGRSYEDKETRATLYYSVGKEFKDQYGVWSGTLWAYSQNPDNPKRIEPVDGDQ